MKAQLARPLLTAAEEQRLGRAVRKMIALEAQRASLAATLRRPPTDAEVAFQEKSHPALVRNALVEGREARATMILSNLRLVVNICRKMKASLPRDSLTGVDRDGGSAALDDLVAEGALGLARAVDRFEPERGLRFSTYATWWVRQAVQKAVRSRSVIRVPVHVQMLQKQRDNVTAALRDELGRPPTAAAVAARLAVSERRLAAVSRAGISPISLDARVGRGAAGKGSGAAEAAAPTALADLVATAEPEPADCAGFHELRDGLAAAMGSALVPAERDVLRLRLGLDDGARRTRREVGDVCGIDVKAVRALERRALTKLRYTPDCARLRDYCDLADGEFS